ncbi:centrosomal protein of 126 kDa [Ambystoma mexicanum]|uniref:centrosomal protein of 126 kDa n=1 Tax=Ambystoma mexicanum TaxID=8296 RepID=UPI0037E7F5E4
MLPHRRAGSYSNLRTQLERDIEEERQALLEDQKLCRRRAHKFSTETNRRRKALEEKRREEEEKELRFREEVLHQRKQKLQEATEKFQRAHLPPSQRRRTVRTVHRKPTPRLEDALDQIQGSVIPSTTYCSPANRYSTARIADSPSSTILGSGPWFQIHLPSKGDYEKMVQEKVGVNFQNNQLQFKQHLGEAQRLLEDQHLSQLQEFDQQIKYLTRSESLSSLDSLEDVENAHTSTPHTSASKASSQEDSLSYKPQRPQSGKSSHLRAAGEGIVRDEHVNKWLQDFDYQNTPNTISNVVSHRNSFYPNDKHIKNLTPQSNAKTEQTNTTLYSSHATTALETTEDVFRQENKEEKVIPKMNAWVSQSPAFEMVSREKMLSAGSPARGPTKAWATPDPTPRHAVQVSTQEDRSEPKHATKPSSLHPDNFSATPVVLPSSENSNSPASYYSGNATNSLQESKQLNDCHTVPIIVELDDLMNESNVDRCSVPVNPANSEINNNQRPAVSQVITRASLLLHYNNQKARTDQKENLSTTAPFSYHAASSIHPFQDHQKQLNITVAEETNFLKGILKKHSKYENGYSKTMLVGRGIHFGNQNTTYIRDSVELSKGKGRDFENQKTIKKLRWFDEIDNIIGENNVTKILESESSYFQSKAQSDNRNLRSVSSYANNQEYSPKSAHMTNNTGSEVVPAPVISTGYHFTRQAWMASKGEDGTTEANNSDSQKNNLPKGKTKVIRRARSAKTPSESRYMSRKGAVIRPQSATEANKVMKTQGKIIMPHPPPKYGSDNRPGQNDTAHHPQQTNQFDVTNALQNDQRCNKDKPESSGAVHNVVYNNNSVIVMPTPPPYSAPSYETTSKTTVTVNTVQTVAQKEAMAAPSKRIPLYGENGLRLDRTPTDEEITLLWHGVRDALAQKDYSTGDLRHYEQHAINPYILQPSRPNVSHVTIDGASLINNPKSFLRMNGFFTPPSSAAIALARRKQILDTTENKRRALLEQRRQPVDSSGWRSNQHVQNSVHTVQISPFSCAFEPVKTGSGKNDAEEVSESTSQFLLAENLVETSAPDGEILAVMESMKPSQHAMLLSQAQRLGISALSLEEQKIQQSIDRLNQKLQLVQETIIRNPSSASVLQITSPLNLKQYTSSQATDTNSQVQRYRSISADNRTRLLRKF